MQSCCTVLAIENQWSFHEPSLKDTLVQHFDVSKKKHLEVCPLLEVHKELKICFRF